MNRAAMWTDEEVETIERNYPKYGYDLDKWDARLNRSEKAIKSKATRMGLAYSAKFGSRLDRRDMDNLRVVADGLCERLGLSMRNLAREIAVFANDDTSRRSIARHRK